VLNFVSPSVNGDCPVAITFDVNVVYTTDNFKETIFTPMATPRITNAPIFDTVFFTPTNNTDFVILLKSSRCIVINSIGILNESFGVGNCA
jgi:hypothetical protein